MPRGRPRGVRNGEGTKLAPIVKWTILHERVVHFHIATLPNDEIARRLDISPTRVSQIINDPKAQKLIKAVQSRMREQLEKDITLGLVSLAEKSVERLAETINEDFESGTRAKVHQDQMALALLKGTGHLMGEPRGEIADRPPLNERLAERLIQALEKSNKVEEYNGKILDGEAVIIEEDEGENSRKRGVA